MRNLKLEIGYDGTDYCGWQEQARKKANKPSIQGTIEKALRKILQEKIQLTASGRTDAGVHALAQVANFKTKTRIPLVKLQRAANGLLPDDISISMIEEVDPEFNSRFQAKSKVYRYLILNHSHRSALLKHRVYFYPYLLDTQLMRQASKYLLGRHDFKSFCASGSDTKTTIRTIKKIDIRKVRCSLYTAHCTLLAIDIEANGFLYNMARRIIGMLLEIGRGRFPKQAGPTAPAEGLYLVKVNYD